MTPQREQAAAVQQNFSAYVATTRADGRISEPEKVRRVALAYVDAKMKAAGLQQVEEQSLADRQAVLDERLYGVGGDGSPTAIISGRDAADRASRLSSPDEASAAYDAATRNRDSVLQCAIAKHAASQGYTSVHSRYISSNQNRQRDADELDTLNAIASPDARTQLEKAAAFSLPTPSGFTDGQLRQIASKP